MPMPQAQRHDIYTQVTRQIVAAIEAGADWILEVGPGTGVAPLMLAAPVALAATCAFMLPVATPPNAIAYGSGYVSIPQMIGIPQRLNRELPDGASFDNLAEARGRLIAWRHTVSFVRPIMTLSIRHLLVPQLAACTTKQAEQMVSDWNTQGKQLGEALRVWEQALARFNDKAEVEPAHWWKRVNQDDPTALKQRLQRAAQNEELLEHWLEYRRLRKRLADLGFEAVIFAAFAASDSCGVSSSKAPAPLACSGAVEFGFTVMIAVPVVTFALTV